MAINHSVSCDLCRKRNFTGRRYKCLLCHDFDLCSICYDKNSNLSIQTHSIHHPMQLILTSNDYEYIYFGNIRTEYSSISLTCSLCNQNGFSLDFLIKHINEQHLFLKYSVLCPICFLRQTNLSEHLHQHTNNENLLLKTKIKTWNSNQQSLLDRFINNYQNKNENEQQRKLFIHILLTDLLSQ